MEVTPQPTPEPTPEPKRSSFFDLRAWARDLVVSLFIAGILDRKSVV